MSTDDPGTELRRLRRLIADLDAVVFEAEAPSMRFTYVSEGLADLLGFSSGEWLAVPGFLSGRVHPEDRDRLFDAIRRASDRVPLDVEFRFRVRDGAIVWLHASGRAVQEPDGRTLLRGVLVDVTTRMIGEAREREAEERYRALIEQLPAIVYVQTYEPGDQPGAMLYLSSQLERILGFVPDEWTRNPKAWAERFHPEDRERVRRLSDEVAGEGRRFSAQYRMLAKDGRTVWLQDDAVVVRDERGIPLYWQGVMLDVTEAKLAEQRLREAEERYRLLVEQLPAIVYTESAVGDDLQVVYVSPRVRDVLGYTPLEWTADPQTWLGIVHPEDREAVEEANRRADETGEPFVAEYRAVAKDGRVLWFHDEAELVRDETGEPRYWQGVMLDVTGQQLAQEELEETQARYRALVEHMPAITYLDAIDGPQATLYISPQTTEILGYAPEEWYADSGLWERIVHPDDRDREDIRGYTDPAGEPHGAEYRLIAKDGGVVWVHDQAIVIRDEEGKPRYWQGLLVDITEQKRIEELERDLELEREATQHLRALDEMKNTFLQAVSHDLRTPLAAILGLAVTLGREDVQLPTDDVRELADRIAVNARKLDRLVGDLLDLDRMGRGILEPNRAPTDLGALVERVVGESGLAAGRVAGVAAPRVVLELDAPKVERIVENLLANAARHTPAASRLWVSVHPAEGGAELRVEDDGPGVAQADREAIFEPFRRGPEGTTGVPGVGVGLALVRRFAELHGGRAWVGDREGGGASFRVFLPAGGEASRGPDGGTGSGAEDAPERPQPTGSGSPAGTSASSPNQE